MLKLWCNVPAEGTKWGAFQPGAPVACCFPSLSLLGGADLHWETVPSFALSQATPATVDGVTCYFMLVHLLLLTAYLINSFIWNYKYRTSKICHNKTLIHFLKSSKVNFKFQPGIVVNTCNPSTQELRGSKPEWTTKKYSVKRIWGREATGWEKLIYIRFQIHWFSQQRAEATKSDFFFVGAISQTQYLMVTQQARYQISHLASTSIVII